MSLKTLGKLFIGVGVGLLVYGLTMDTSVSTGYGRVVNLGLANDRLMFILIGAVAHGKLIKREVKLVDLVCDKLEHS